MMQFPSATLLGQSILSGVFVGARLKIVIPRSRRLCDSIAPTEQTGPFSLHVGSG